MVGTIDNQLYDVGIYLTSLQPRMFLLMLFKDIFQVIAFLRFWLKILK